MSSQRGSAAPAVKEEPAAPADAEEDMADPKNTHYDVTVQLPHKRQYMVVYVTFRILQVVRSVWL